MALAFTPCLPLGWVTPRWAVVALAVVAWIVQLADHVVWGRRQQAFLTNMVVRTGDWPRREPEG